MYKDMCDPCIGVFKVVVVTDAMREGRAQTITLLLVRRQRPVAIPETEGQCRVCVMA